MNLWTCWKNPFIHQLEQIHILFYVAAMSSKTGNNPKTKTQIRNSIEGDNRTGIHLIRTIVFLPADKRGGLWQNSGTVHRDLLCVVMIYGHVSNTFWSSIDCTKGEQLPLHRSTVPKAQALLSSSRCLHTGGQIWFHHKRLTWWLTLQISEWAFGCNGTIMRMMRHDRIPYGKTKAKKKKSSDQHISVLCNS